MIRVTHFPGNWLYYIISPSGKRFTAASADQPKYSDNHFLCRVLGILREKIQMGIYYLSERRYCFYIYLENKRVRT